MNNTPNIPKRGRGRPAGSTSLTNVTLEQLNEIFPQHTVLPVGAVWLREHNIAVQLARPIAMMEAQVPVAEEEKIQFHVEDFSEQLPPPPAEIFVD